MACLNDGRPTRVNRVTSGVSAPDVCLVHPSMIDGANWRVLPLTGSDHNPIRIVVEVNTVHIREDESKLEWNWKEADLPGFREVVNQRVAENLDSLQGKSMKDRVAFLNESIMSAARTHVGKIRVKRQGRSWMTADLRRKIKRRNLLGRDLRYSRVEWLEACREVRELTVQCKREAWRKFAMSLSTNTNSSKAWGVIRLLNGKAPQVSGKNEALGAHPGGGGRVLVTPKAKANDFVKHYSPGEKKMNLYVGQLLLRDHLTDGLVGP